MSSAEAKLREQLAAANGGVIDWQHEGEGVIRWLTGGLAPSIHATFKHHQGGQVAACCPQCGMEIGRFDGNYGPDAGGQIVAIRYAGADHRC
jgi:hypothetical protein